MCVCFPKLKFHFKGKMWECEENWKKKNPTILKEEFQKCFDQWKKNHLNKCVACQGDSFEENYQQFEINHNCNLKEVQMLLYNQNKLATLVKGNPKAPFSIATIPGYRRGPYSIPWIAPLSPWFLPYNADC